MSHEASVDELKNAIKEDRRPLFNRIDADTLDLYKISVIEDNLDAKLGEVDLKFLKNLKVLLPKCKLSQVLSDPPIDHHVDIIVVLPPGGECK
jgi:Crinkler effector protein N-terminal domain